MCLWGPFPFKPPHPDFVTNSNLPLLQEPIVDTCVKHELIQLASELGGILATFILGHIILILQLRPYNHTAPSPTLVCALNAGKLVSPSFLEARYTHEEQL